MKEKTKKALNIDSLNNQGVGLGDCPYCDHPQKLSQI